MTETVDYHVLGHVDKVEIRSYPSMLLATVEEMTDEKAFNILFRYISGENRVSARMEMTAPVISAGPGHQRLPMISPVVSDSRSFSFVMPKGYTAHDIPEPLDQRVRIEAKPPRKLAVLRFRGRLNRQRLERHTNELLSSLDKGSLESEGEPFLMRYNPPFTPGFLRRNEVAVEVRGDLRGDSYSLS